MSIIEIIFFNFGILSVLSVLSYGITIWIIRLYDQEDKKNKEKRLVSKCTDAGIRGDHNAQQIQELWKEVNEQKKIVADRLNWIERHMNL